jgi:hypothetical protein
MRIIKALNHKELVEKHKSSIDYEPYLRGYLSKYFPIEVILAQNN